MNWLLRLLPASALRHLRKYLLAYARRMDVERLQERAQRAAVGVALQAARHSSAYRTLLLEQHIEVATLGPQTALTNLPVLTKHNTFARFTLAELARPLPAQDIADVLTSAGRGGLSFGLRLSPRAQHDSAWFDIDLGLQDMFNVDQQPTLLVNCLPMGVVFNSRAVTVANVSVREDMACAILRDLGPRYQQTLLCADPLFIRRLLDEARVAGVDWPALNTSVILGEEVLVEAQRDYLAARMGIDLDGDSHRIIGSSFGVGELGLNLLFETRETIRLRRAMRIQTRVAELLGGRVNLISAPSIFCYNPLRCHVEILKPGADGFGELCLTLLDANAVIALPRYATGDLGRRVSRQAVTDAAGLAGTVPPWLPVVAVKGRIKDQPPDRPAVEHIKEMIYSDHVIADQLTGAFRLTPGESGGVRLTLQTVSEAAAQNPLLYEQLGRLARQLSAYPLDLELLAPLAFPYRPLLDFERKFIYLAPTAF